IPSSWNQKFTYAQTSLMLVGHPFASASHAQPFMNPVALAVDDLRDQYLREMALVRQTCERTGDGTAAIRRRSAVVDRILIEMWRRAFSGLPPQKVALLALGGYGRKDLFPYSVLVRTTDYTADATTVRRLAAPLPGIAEPKPDVANKLLQMIDAQLLMLERKGPSVDYVRLCMVLVETEAAWYPDQALSRLEEICYFIAGLDVDLRLE